MVHDITVRSVCGDMLTPEYASAMCLVKDALHINPRDPPLSARHDRQALLIKCSLFIGRQPTSLCRFILHPGKQCRNRVVVTFENHERVRGSNLHVRPISIEWYGVPAIASLPLNMTTADSSPVSSSSSLDE